MTIFQQMILYGGLSSDVLHREHISEHNSIGHHTIQINKLNREMPYFVSVSKDITMSGETLYDFSIINKAWNFLPETYTNKSLFARIVYNMYVRKIKNWNKQK